MIITRTNRVIHKLDDNRCTVADITAFIVAGQIPPEAAIYIMDRRSANDPVTLEAIWEG